MRIKKGLLSEIDQKPSGNPATDIVDKHKYTRRPNRELDNVSTYPFLSSDGSHSRQYRSTVLTQNLHVELDPGEYHHV